MGGADMVEQPQMGEPELRQRLLEFDRAVGVLHPGKTLYLVLAGGGLEVVLGAICRRV